ncbi:orotate phosphoribosyltransferase [Rossellomorea marisflavi]|uniref:Orotate phosphoribosyltransferase n=1 Tax=Rossellomorea marisflavi TaxID=189381 RepID=A0A0J5VD52_9BACI|nr:orotate phosphoribosyltransferase [Rossellomorea marisflavi]KMK96571.1 orotate phosphoribosyltransferase [Rossellomorea marisflavi]KML32775.1 orotate phosphoribosyltransferase [Rossellomorea marisflavi]KZE49758.1 orotate phosphoribosyltransferase [Rossellomorea marisflavi]QHA36094.1 orotate phosphoribosyltransferase [Rossellomorea marisflavi]TYO72257.1 orotate phosphoribosyltransferase [Rossellomorea marisflavi]
MKKQIAKELLNIKAVFLNPGEPFTWSSGIKSPIYCDNRLTLSYPAVRKQIADGLVSMIREHFPEVDVIAGTATAGIPHAAWVSERMDLPMCYVRSKAKGHGKGNQIEGKILPGQKVVVIEDLISTGGSCITAVEALRESECEVLGVAAIFTYELQKGADALREHGIEAFSLSNYSSLLEAAEEEGLISGADLVELKEWSRDPEGWKKQVN